MLFFNNAKISSMVWDKRKKPFCLPAANSLELGHLLEQDSYMPFLIQTKEQMIFSVLCE